MTKFAVELPRNKWTDTVALVDPVTGEAVKPGSNFNNKLREAFETFDYQSANAPWSLSLAPGDIVRVDGNAAGASYLVISKSPLTVGETRIESRVSFPMPLEVASGIHRSQPQIGQETSFEVVNDDGVLDTVEDLQIASISQATTVLTVNTVKPHGLVPGKRIGIRDCADSRANYAALVVTSTPTPTQFTATSYPGTSIPSTTIATQTSGYVYARPSLGYATDGTSMIMDSSTATVASYYVRGAGGDSLPSGTIATSHAVTIATTASVQAVAATGTYAFQPGVEQRVTMFVDQVQWTDQAIDSGAQATTRRVVRQVVPNPDKKYKPRIRVTNYSGLTRPVAKIVSISKSGTTTATVTTDVPHGLVANLDYIYVYGVREQTNFPNLSTQTVVASVIDANRFTVVLGTALTATSYGGYVSRANGSIIQAGAVTQAIQSATVANNLLTLVGNVAWAGVVIGDYVNVHGCRNSVNGGDMLLDGAYQVRDIVTTSLVLEPIGTTTLPTSLATTNCGGGVIKRTDTRISYLRLLDFERLRVEMMPRPIGDMSAAVPVTVQNSFAVSAVQSTAAAIGTEGAGAWSVRGTPSRTVDVSPAAITTTAASTAISLLGNTGAFQVNFDVTAVSGTTPRMIGRVQGSFDNGTNFVNLYDVGVMTNATTKTNGTPVMPVEFTHIKYVRTLTGTSPSFTNSVNRVNRPLEDGKRSRRLIDAVMSLTTTTASTEWLYVGGCGKGQITATAMTGATTLPVLKLQACHGDPAIAGNWFDVVGATLTTSASAMTASAIFDLPHALFVRLIPSTAGVATPASTAYEICVTAWE